jgi:tetratricopeptide (TPR) repeat protein
VPRAIKAEMKGLSAAAAETVTAYLVMAGQLLDSDPDLAYQHAEAARRRAPRLTVTREAAAEAAYAAGRYEEALTQFRVLNRMTGAADYLPVMADCWRALDKPREALTLIQEGLSTVRDPAMAIELRIVEAGARDDLGQSDEAERVLRQVIEHPPARVPAAALARAWYAWADLVARHGRLDEARSGFRRAAQLDTDGTTDAVNRLDEFDGFSLIIDESDDFDDTDSEAESDEFDGADSEDESDEFDEANSEDEFDDFEEADWEAESDEFDQADWEADDEVAAADGEVTVNQRDDFDDFSSMIDESDEFDDTSPETDVDVAEYDSDVETVPTTLSETVDGDAEESLTAAEPVEIVGTDEPGDADSGSEMGGADPETDLATDGVDEEGGDHPETDQEIDADDDQDMESDLVMTTEITRDDSSDDGDLDGDVVDESSEDSSVADDHDGAIPTVDGTSVESAETTGDDAGAAT